MVDVSNFLENFIKKESLFKNKAALQSSYNPDEILHRDEQLLHILKILAPSLRLERPSNLFIYGKTGSGKTLTVQSSIKQIQVIASRDMIPIKFLYLNCKLKKVADTEYRLIAEITRMLGKEVAPTGLPTDEVYRTFYKKLEEEKQVVILILDEIDQLIKKIGDEVIYNLTRINTELKNAQLALVGISNDIMFADNLDPRVKSSLSEEELVFPSYNALQIQDILKKRSGDAIKEGVLDEGVIPKCAAYAAREHGDARRALELLRVAVELAERKGIQKISIKELDEAEEKIEKDRVLDIITTQPKQFQLVLYSILLIYDQRRQQNIIFTGEIYLLYKDLCNKTNLRPLTQRRVSDVIAEFDLLGIINAKVISKGRYGRTREVSMVTNDTLNAKIKNLLENALKI
ncbi:MAG TPA: orc1/cdc6 family replication initiation protein [Alphaproteobacteria bacterium]|nr:orc1/cdc6 family replication initiation protein [Alphaproteobacteria bacterium]